MEIQSSPQPVELTQPVPYYIRNGYKIVCQKMNCMHYGGHPNCILPSMERDGECFALNTKPSLDDGKLDS